MYEDSIVCLELTVLLAVITLITSSYDKQSNISTTTTTTTNA